MSTYQTKAIVLRENDSLEADRLFYIYTEKKGKVQVMVKGGKKIQSKLSPHLQSFAVANLLVAKGKNYDRLASGQILQNFANVKNDFGKIAVAYSFIDLVDQLTKTYHPDQKIFNLLLEYLKLLDENNFSTLQLKNILSFFILKLLHFLGYSPELYNCLYCKKKIIPDGNFFNPKKGGLVCMDCQESKSITSIKITENAIKVMRMVLKESAGKLMKVKIDKRLSNEIENLVNKFLEFQIDQPLSSRNFVEIALTPYKNKNNS